MIVYLDTSVVLRELFDQPPRAHFWGQWQRAYSSEMLGVEARRAIDRVRLDGALDDDGVARAHESLATIESTLGLVAITRQVLVRASHPMPTMVKTLDAIHLATALLVREQRESDMEFATFDSQQGRAARALGFAAA